DDQLNDLIGPDDLDDDQADDTDDATDIASMDADLWNDLQNRHATLGHSAAADALTALEQHGPDEMANVAWGHLDKPVDVVTDPETGLPHLRYRNPEHRRRPTTRGRRKQPDIDLDQLGPAAKAWYGATTNQHAEVDQ
ncbi:MAG: hypothetical protein AAGK32_21855, partial [Actinomycetota bacterium]